MPPPSEQVITEFTGATHRFLSNFYMVPLVAQVGPFGPYNYRSVEHGYQAAKAMTLTDHERIRTAYLPGIAKRLGRSVILPDNWEDRKIRVMTVLLLAKFTRTKLRANLLATGNAELVEGNSWHDNEWGNCSCARCCGVPGRNLLGKLLMELRDRLRGDRPPNLHKRRRQFIYPS